MTPIDIPVVVNPPDLGPTVNQFKALKNSLREAIGELAGLTEGTEAYIAQANRVGQIRDQVNDLNAAVNAVSGSPIENLSGSFGLLSGQVSSLDFDGATASLQQFSGNIRSFSFKDLIAGAKSFTSTLGTLGKALLSNPIFLIGGIIIAVGAAVFALKDKIKFLSDAFEYVGKIIGDAVQQLKDFADFIGLTSFAAEEAAEKQIDAAAKATAAVTERYDREIKYAKAAGKDVAQLEKDKAKAVQNSILEQGRAIAKLAVINGKFSEEQIKQIEDLVPK